MLTVYFNQGVIAFLEALSGVFFTETSFLAFFRIFWPLDTSSYAFRILRRRSLKSFSCLFFLVPFLSFASLVNSPFQNGIRYFF